MLLAWIGSPEIFDSKISHPHLINTWQSKKYGDPGNSDFLGMALESYRSRTDTLAIGFRLAESDCRLHATTGHSIERERRWASSQ